jgi:hypothetical protein
LDEDGKVTLLEAYRYAYRGTVKDSALGSTVVQHPNFDIDLSGTEDFVMTTPAAASCRVVLSAPEGGVFQVFSLPYFSPVAELTLSPKKSATLAVPAGRLLIQRRAGDRVKAAELRLNRGETRVVAPHEYAEMSVDVMRHRGGPSDTRPNVVRAAAVGIGDHFAERWIPRYGGSLGYERRFRYFKANLDIWATYARYDTDKFANREVDIMVSLGIGWTRAFGVHCLGVSAGPLFETRFQHRTRLDAKRLRAIGMTDHLEYRLHAFAPGGFLGARWDVTLTTGLDVSLEARGTLAAVPVVDETSTGRLLSAGILAFLGLNYRF